MTATRRYRTYGDWTKGSYGAIGPWDAPRFELEYCAFNMQVYSTGLLGPRPWLHHITYVSPPTISAGDAAFFSFVGLYVLTAAGQLNQIEADGDWGPNVTATGLTAISHGTNVGFNLVLFDGVEAYGVDLITGGSGSPVLATPELVRTGAHFKDRLYVAAQGELTGSSITVPFNRVYFSARANHTSFGASDFIDLSDPGVGINAVVVGRNGIMFFASDYRLYGLIGNDPTDAQLVDLGAVGSGTVVPPIESPQGFAVLNDDVYFTTLVPNTGITVASLAGTDTKILQHLRPGGPWATVAPWTSTPYDANAAGLQYTGNIILPRQVRAGGTDVDWQMERINGAWNYSAHWHDSPDQTGTYDGEDSTWTRFGHGGAAAFGEYVRDQCFVSVDDSADMYARALCLDRPSSSDDEATGDGAKFETYEDALHHAAGAVDLSTIRPENGRSVEPTQVVVDMLYWAEGSKYADPAFSVYVVYDYDSTSETRTLVGSFDGSSLTDTTVNGAPQRYTANIQRAGRVGSFRLEIRGIQSVAFRQITVVYDESDESPQ